jgi:microcystin-dependent protein
MDAYLGEIRIFAGNFAPINWAFCNGAILSIQQYTALFSLIGIAYGGNGTTNFALPNLVANAPMGQGQGIGGAQGSYIPGDSGGATTASLNITTMAAHGHTANYQPYGNQTFPITVTVAANSAVASAGATPNPAGNYLTDGPKGLHSMFTPQGSLAAGPMLSGTTAAITPGSVGSATITFNPSGSPTPAPFNIQPPYLALNFIICIAGGMFPQRP